MVHLSIVSTLMDLLDETGCALTPSLAAAKMPTRIIEERRGYIPVRTFCGWVDRESQRQGIDNLGLAAVMRAGIQGLQPGLVMAIAGSPTLYDGLQTFTKLAYRESSQVTIWLDERHEDPRLCHRGSFPRSLPGQPEMSWWALGMLVQVVRLFLGPTWNPAVLGVPAQGRGKALAIDMFPGARLIDDPETAWISIPRRLLGTAPLTIDDAVLKPGDSEVLASPPGGLEDCLSELVTRYLPDGAPRIEAAAESAGLSVRTLQRRLASQQLSYEKLVSSLRLQQARDLLRQQDLAIGDIARRLGYSHASHFARAFRRLAGVSPRAYRADCRG